MACSDARLNANRLNSQKSTGPKTPEGKERSRRNGLKHGLTGEGIVVPEGDAEEIERRVEELELDLSPRSPIGSMMIRKMALLSVRAERAGERENAAIAERVRHAVDDFDEARIDRANDLFDHLHEDPRGNLRKLRKMPEGVDRLVEDWRNLRLDLQNDPRPRWAAAQLERAALMTGYRAEHARACPVGILSRGIWGDFARLEENEGGDLAEEERQAWARGRMLELIDEQIADLEAHRETLDYETLEVDRREAPVRALFDSSKAAALAHRYEADAHRTFFKALKEFRQAEAESLARPESPRSPAGPLEPDPRLASSCDRASTPPRPPAPTRFDLEDDEITVVRSLDGRPLSIGRPPQPPR